MKGNAMAASDRPHSLPEKDAARGEKEFDQCRKGENGGRGSWKTEGEEGEEEKKAATEKKEKVKEES